MDPHKRRDDLRECCPPRRDQQLRRSTTTGGLWLMAVSFLISSNQAEAQSHAFSPPAPEQLDPLFAPSPQREFHLSWNKCVDAVANLILAQDGSLEQIEALAFGGCSDEESRLAGAVIKAYGYDKGNAAMRQLKTRKRSRYAALLQERDRSRILPGLVSQTKAGWKVFRKAEQDCAAILARPDLIRPSFTVMQVSGTEKTIFFGESGSTASSQAKRYSQGTQLKLSVGKFVNLTAVDLGLMTLEVSPFQDGLGFSMPLSNALVEALSDAESLQFRPRVPGYPVAPPRSYPVRGIRAAWEALRGCSDPPRG